MGMEPFLLLGVHMEFQSTEFRTYNNMDTFWTHLEYKKQPQKVRLFWTCSDQSSGLLRKDNYLKIF